MLQALQAIQQCEGLETELLFRPRALWLWQCLGIGRGLPPLLHTTRTH